MSLATTQLRSSSVGYTAVCYKRPAAEATAISRAMTRESAYTTVSLRVMGRLGDGAPTSAVVVSIVLSGSLVAYARPAHGQSDGASLTLRHDSPPEAQPADGGWGRRTWSLQHHTECCASAFYFLVLTVKSAKPVTVKQAASHSESSVCKNKNTNAAMTSSTIPAKRRLRFTVRRSLVGRPSSHG